VRGEVEKPLGTFVRLAILGASSNILKSRLGLASTLAFGFSNGGPVPIIQGLLLISVVHAAIAAFLLLSCPQDTSPPVTNTIGRQSLLRQSSAAYWYVVDVILSPD